LHQGALNVVGWILVIAGLCSFIAAAVGLFLVVGHLVRHAPISITDELHGSYYVIRHTKRAVWPLLALLLCSAFITVGGYIHTDRFVNSLLRRYFIAPDKQAHVSS
jgi:hypothetical protein